MERLVSYLRIKVGVIIITVATLALTYGSAALTSVTIDRTITAGTVKSDIDKNVSVKFEALESYESMMRVNKKGVVSFDLSQAMINGADGFNPDAQFTIGNAKAGVFQITNNSNISIKVSLKPGVHCGLVLKDSNGEKTPTIIDSGKAQSFYFEIDSTGSFAGNTINGILLIREK